MAEKVKEILINQALKSRILDSIDRLNKTVLIVGDIGIDEYVLGQVRRISPEAPVPVLEVEEEDYRLGLSGNVAQNIVSLGGKANLVSVIGQDMSAVNLKELLKNSGVSSDFLVTDHNRPTTKKTRIMAKHHHLVRVDYELKKFIEPQIENELLAKVAALVPKSDIIILQDYAKGVISRNVISRVVSLGREHNKLVLLDPHRTNPAEFYKGVDLIKPNFDEALALAGISYEDYRLHGKSLTDVGETIRKMVESRYVVLTRGKEGMLSIGDEAFHSVPTFARQVFDVTGAGDTVIAALALGIASGFPVEEACVLANFAAGVVVGKIGCVPCTKQELRDYINETN